MKIGEVTMLIDPKTREIYRFKVGEHIKTDLLVKLREIYEPDNSAHKPNIFCIGKIARLRVDIPNYD